MDIVIIVLITLTLCIGCVLKGEVDKIRLKDKLDTITEQKEILQEEVSNLENKLNIEKDNYSKILSQKKSSETRLGQISENLVPFLAGFKYDAKASKFLGDPIDYIVFDLDAGEIVFLEVKTGNSRLTKKQKIIKNIIEQGRVRFEEFKINTKGIKIKSSGN